MLRVVCGDGGLQSKYVRPLRAGYGRAERGRWRPPNRRPNGSTGRGRAPVERRWTAGQPAPPYRSGAYRTSQQPNLPERPKTDPVPAADVRRVLLDVRGMTCPIKCVRDIKEQIQAVPGVSTVYVDFDAKTAVVRVDAGTDPESLAAAVRPPYSAHVLDTFAN